MSKSQDFPATMSFWGRLWRWVTIMDEAMDTSETEILERRIEALEFAVAELERALKTRSLGKTASG